jgi:hypothetical protein
MKRLLEILHWEVSGYETDGLYWTGFVIAVGVYVLCCWPWVPGIAIGLLGLVGAIMAVRADHFKVSRREQFVWILIATVLFIWEINSIIRDRDEHDREQAEFVERQRQGFEQIGKGIEKELDMSRVAAEGLQLSIKTANASLAETRQTVAQTIPRANIALLKHKYQEPDLCFSAWYENLGNGTARDFVWYAAIYFGKKRDEATQQQIKKEFETEWDNLPATNKSQCGHEHHKYNAPSTVSPVDKGYYDYFNFPPMSADERKRIFVDKTDTIYAVARFSYTDDTGKWCGDFCDYGEDPGSPSAPAHPCSVLNNHRYKPKEPKREHPKT